MQRKELSFLSKVWFNCAIRNDSVMSFLNHSNPTSIKCFWFIRKELLEDLPFDLAPLPFPPTPMRPPRCGPLGLASGLVPGSVMPSGRPRNSGGLALVVGSPATVSRATRRTHAATGKEKLEKLKRSAMVKSKTNEVLTCTSVGTAAESESWIGKARGAAVPTDELYSI